MWWRIKTEENAKVYAIVDEVMSGRIVTPSYTDDSSKKADYNRWIQVQSAFPSMENVHYELVWDDWKLYWELHIEPQNKVDGYKYSRIARFIKEIVNNETIFSWHHNGSAYIVRYKKSLIQTLC